MKDNWLDRLTVSAFFVSNRFHESWDQKIDMGTVLHVLQRSWIVCIMGEILHRIQPLGIHIDDVWAEIFQLLFDFPRKKLS